MHQALFTVKSYREFSGRIEITLYGYTKGQDVFTFQVPISHKGFDFAKVRNRFLKKVKAWSIRSNVWLRFANWRIETVEKSAKAINEHAGHWQRISPRQWKRKSKYTRASNGKYYERAECRADTKLHYSNCGLPIPEECRFGIRTIRK